MIEKQALDAIGNLRQPWLIVTDLDGTLLDHHSYSHQAVDALLLPALFSELEGQALSKDC